MAEVTTKDFVAKIADLQLSEENPRKISRRDFEKLKQSLIDFPEMKKLRQVIVDENLKVLAGHQRLLALQDLDYEDVEVRQVIGLTKKQKREFMVKDNVSSGKWDADVFANFWDVEEVKGFGIDPFKLPSDSEDDKKQYKNHEVTCPHCGEHFELSEAE